jgi:LacI family transcriptional regulator
VCYNDIQAYGLIRAARQRQVDLTRRLSIVGYGDLELSRLTSPALTTQHIPAFDVGRIAAATLLQRINKQPSQNHVIGSQLIVRESTGKPPGDVA